MQQIRQLALRAALSFVDTFLGLIIAGGILSGTGHAPAITLLEQAALAAAAPAISILRNGLSLLAPAVPSTIPPAAPLAPTGA